jgi:non-specific serine/threonine protein kinase
MDNRESTLMVRFGRFLLDSHRRELLADGVPVPIGSRAFDILVVLVEAAGQLVTKAELLSRVWPGRLVEENNLQFHISSLRKGLAPDREFIKTIAGRGYRFIADITTHDPDAVPFLRRGASPPSTDFPAAMANLIAYEAKLAGLADLVTAYRLGALVGASGIGGTGPNIESRQRLLSELAYAAWIAAPGPSSHPERVFPAVAPVVQLSEAGPTPPEDITAALALEPLVLRLAIGDLTFESRDYGFPPQETLPVETNGRAGLPDTKSTELSA